MYCPSPALQRNLRLKPVLMRELFSWIFYFVKLWTATDLVYLHRGVAFSTDRPTGVVDASFTTRTHFTKEIPNE